MGSIQQLDNVFTVAARQILTAPTPKRYDYNIFQDFASMGAAKNFERHTLSLEIIFRIQPARVHIMIARFLIFMGDTAARIAEQLYLMAERRLLREHPQQLADDGPPIEEETQGKKVRVWLN